MKICYHGTNKKNAENILKEGFNKGTYFAKHLEDAIGFGGRYVFSVMFKKEKIPSNWQFILKRKRKPNNIVYLRYYPVIKTLYKDEKLGDKIFKSNLKVSKLN